MSLDFTSPLIFHADYFLYEKTPEIESVESQLNRLFASILDKVNDQFEPSIDEFRRNYLHKKLVDGTGNTLLHKLVLHNRNIKYFKEAIKQKNVDINAQNHEGNTPYHFAACIKSTKYLREFRILGAFIDIKNNQGITVEQLLREL